MGAQKTLLNQALSLGGDVLVALNGNRQTIAKEIALLFQKLPRSIDPLVHTETKQWSWPHRAQDCLRHRSFSFHEGQSSPGKLASAVSHSS